MSVQFSIFVHAAWMQKMISFIQHCTSKFALQARKHPQSLFLEADMTICRLLIFTTVNVTRVTGQKVDIFVIRFPLSFFFFVHLSVLKLPFFI